MIYKFNTDDESVNLEIEQSGDQVLLTISDLDSEYCPSVTLEKEALYDIIGCLHSIQSKIKKEGV